MTIDGRSFSDRVEAAPSLASAIVRAFDLPEDSSLPEPAVTYRGFIVKVRRAGFSAVRLCLRCPDRADALEYATARSLELAQVPAYGIGLFARLDHVLASLDAELASARSALPREETNLSSYAEQLSSVFEHEGTLLEAQREIARIEDKLSDVHRTESRTTGRVGQDSPSRIAA